MKKYNILLDTFVKNNYNIILCILLLFILYNILNNKVYSFKSVLKKKKIKKKIMFHGKEILKKYIIFDLI